MKVIVIGGGPAGMLAAISAGMNKDDVTILEKMKKLGKKLLITGKGRCNITSSIPIDEFIKNVPGNGKFLYSCFNNFTNDDILNILKEEGLQTKVERGNRVFPITDKYVQSYLISDPFDLMVKNIIDNNESEIIQACQDYLFECENGNKHFMTPDIDGIIKMLDMLDENKDTN